MYLLITPRLGEGFNDTRGSECFDFFDCIDCIDAISRRVI